MYSAILTCRRNAGWSNARKRLGNIAAVRPPASGCSGLLRCNIHENASIFNTEEFPTPEPPSRPVCLGHYIRGFAHRLRSRTVTLKWTRQLRLAPAIGRRIPATIPDQGLTVHRTTTLPQRASTTSGSPHGSIALPTPTSPRILTARPSLTFVHP